MSTSKGDDLNSRILYHQSHYHHPKRYHNLQNHQPPDKGPPFSFPNTPDINQRELDKLVGEPLRPSFAESAYPEWPALFVKKLRIASKPTPVMTSPSGMISLKTDTLQELVALVSESHRLPFDLNKFGPQLTRCFAENVFRDTGPHVNPLGMIFDPEEDEPVLESDWLHLQLHYELFVRFLESARFNPNNPALRQLIDDSFLSQLLAVFDSEDPREREAAKTVLHRLYGKFLPLRPGIRHHLQNLFAECVEEEELNATAPQPQLRMRHNIAELLEILGSIVNGFAIPLREEHRSFLLKTLLPLHKCRSLSLFHAQLTYCCVQSVDKDPTLRDPVVRSLLRLWPKTHSGKQILFLRELEQLLDECSPTLFPAIAPVVADHLAKALSSPHFQVAERALGLMASNEFISQLVLDNATVMLPKLFPPLNFHCRPHWNRNVQAMSLAVLKSLMDNTPQLFEEALQKALTQEDTSSSNSWNTSFSSSNNGIRRKSLVLSPSVKRR